LKNKNIRVSFLMVVMLIRKRQKSAVHDAIWKKEQNDETSDKG